MQSGRSIQQYGMTPHNSLKYFLAEFDLSPMLEAMCCLIRPR